MFPGAGTALAAILSTKQVSPHAMHSNRADTPIAHQVSSHPSVDTRFHTANIIPVSPLSNSKVSRKESRNTFWKGCAVLVLFCILPKRIK